MSDSSANQPQYRDDEIDLRKLFQSIGNFFSNIGRGFINLLIRFKRITISYKYVLIGAVVIGGAIGLAQNKLGKEEYQTSLLLKSDYFNAKLIANSIDKLNLLCEEPKRTGLANVMGIDVETALNIQGFEYEPFVSEQDMVDIEVLKQKLTELKVADQDINLVVDQIEVENKNTFLIIVKVFDNNILGAFQEALVGYFQNTPYIKNRVIVNRNNQQQLIAKLKNDVAALDSLKMAYNLNLQTMATRPNESSNNVYVGEGGIVDPVSLYSQGVSLFRQLQTEQEELELGSDFEVIDGFTVFSKPSSPGLFKGTATSIGILLAIAYGLIMLLEINKYLSSVEKERFDS